MGAPATFFVRIVSVSDPIRYDFYCKSSTKEKSKRQHESASTPKKHEINKRTAQKDKSHTSSSATNNLMLE